jgi:hypothetical protein
MIDDHSVTVTFQQFLAAVFTGLAALTVWLLKRIGSDHIESIKEISAQLSSISAKLSTLGERLTKVEVLQDRFDRECHMRHKTGEHHHNEP